MARVNTYESGSLTTGANTAGCPLTTATVNGAILGRSATAVTVTDTLDGKHEAGVPGRVVRV